MRKCWCVQYHNYQLGTNKPTECECCTLGHMMRLLDHTMAEPVKPARPLMHIYTLVLILVWIAVLIALLITALIQGGFK